MKINSNYIKIKEKEIFYRSSGENSCNSLILIHGLAGDSRLFHNQLKYFANTCRVIAPDLPGHGKSGTCEFCSISDYSAVIESIVKHEALDKPVILGHSMGGAVALQYCISNKEKVKALILVSTAHRFDINKETIALAEDDFENFYKSLITGSFSRKAGLFLMAIQNGIPEELKKTILDDLRICSTVNFGNNLHEIEVPVLIMANRNDGVLDPGLTAEMGQKIPGSKLLLLDSSGHVPFFEESESFNPEVEQFMDKI